jgi:hypothetical protein
VHSYAHRTIRWLAAFAGIERDGLAGYLLPHHLSFVIYAASRGDFVLGGLQAVFETSLHRFLADLVEGESRRALDPGAAAAAERAWRVSTSANRHGVGSSASFIARSCSESTASSSRRSDVDDAELVGGVLDVQKSHCMS